MRRRCLIFMVLSFFVSLLFFGISKGSLGTVNNNYRVKVMEAFGKMPLYFIKNKGQMDEKVKYYMRGGGKSVYFTGEGVYVVLSKRKDFEKVSRERFVRERKLSELKGDREGLITEGIRIKPVKVSGKVDIVTEEPLEGKVNYFIGRDPKKWKTDIPTYGKVRYKNIYPGIDIVFYGNQRELEYDIVVKPGADPNVVKFEYEGAKELKVGKEGELIAVLPSGSEVIQKRPKIYQEVGGKRIEIEGRYVIKEEKSRKLFSFKLSNYNPKYALVIDPVLVYSTYLGGYISDSGYAIAVDSEENIYITGITQSDNFPVKNAFQGTYAGGQNDVFVAKLSRQGDLIYSTYLGGSYNDIGKGIAVDPAGNVYVCGWAGSPDFPTLNAYQSKYGGYFDAFVTKISSTGSLLYSTYLGGSNGDGANGIAVDSYGNAYIVGETISDNFPTKNAFQKSKAGFLGLDDAFIAKFGPDGTLVYSTYFGGSDIDHGHAIAVDSIGNAYVTGETSSIDLPIFNAFQGKKGGESDAFVAKFSPDGGMLYSTYLGGGSWDFGYGIALDSYGNVYITGVTYSNNFPILNAYQKNNAGGSDVFVTKIGPSGSLVFSTYLGGSGDDEGDSIAVDFSGNAYITGNTLSVDFPTLNPLDSKCGTDGNCNYGWNDAFISKFSSQGALVFSTYLGGSGGDYGHGIAVDSSGNAYVVGETDSDDFPIQNPYQGSRAGGAGPDAFVTKLSDSGSSLPCIPPFTDISCGHPFFNEIKWMKDRGISRGWPDGTYRPYEPVTRAAMAVFIVRIMYGDDFTYNATPYFTDVPPEHPFFKYIQKFKELGITKGCGDGTMFCPENNVRREEMAVFLVRAKVGDDFTYSEIPYFSDVPPNHYFFKYIQKFKELGITTGYQDGTYRPSENVKRDAMAAFLYRAFGK